MQNPSLWTVFFVIMIDLIGFGIVLPNLAFYAKSMQASSFWVGLIYSSYSIAQLIFAPLWGSLSDKIGRRPVMLLSTFFSVLFYCALAFIVNPLGLVAIRFLAGAMAGNISTAQAYVSDITDHQNRVKAMGIIGAAFGVGFMLGPAIGAYLSTLLPPPHFSNHAFFWPALCAALMSLLSLVLVFFYLPETLKKKELESASMRGGIFSTIFWRELLSNKGTCVLYAGMFVLIFCQANLYSAFPLYCSERLGLSASFVGYLYALMGLIAILIQGGLIKMIVKRLGEVNTFCLGLILMPIGLTSIALSQNTQQLFLSVALMSVGGSLSTPSVTSLISKQSHQSRLGASMGISQSMAALARALGPLVGGYLYGHFFALPFFFTASLSLSMALVAGFLLKRLTESKTT